MLGLWTLRGAESGYELTKTYLRDCILFARRRNRCRARGVGRRWGQKLEMSSEYKAPFKWGLA
ncbi:hypothetical protein MES4922_300132 [Mesorhizobium ventifaucium]|uniref:Uncharacterized protein n=1 Tax=Mesorhizobium ventifaucium TaxID=666020 RepID=A0ABM9E1I5_9HYPH|nr:hypothetical protein MES4922_300132 [Mesorhizobium ventifaucium]